MMEHKLSSMAKTFTPSPIKELSHLAQRRNTVNLVEGFPNDDVCKKKKFILFGSKQIKITATLFVA
jgi:hypothetical protein